ncbi:MAG: DUF262 domain-containing protein [Armatimonadota bacterium]|jgi:hypothetical protein
MSIGELINMYKLEEIDIHPEFQRFYRWQDLQKTRLIESIVLGIPIPPIFVAQRDDGVLDVIDGLQRLATIFKFVGILRDEDDSLEDALVLGETDYLPAFDGIVWEDAEQPDRAFTEAMRLKFKREKIGVILVKAESDEETKYDLFQRLNTGGTRLTDQELRNCILTLENPELYRLLRRLAKSRDFEECVPITERQTDEQYDLELVLRFMVFRTADPDTLTGIDVGEYLTKRMLEIAGLHDEDPQGLQQEEDAFTATFRILQQQLGEDSFKRWDPNKDDWAGPFTLSGYEAIAMGIGANCKNGEYAGDTDGIREKVKSLWTDETFNERSGAGVRGSTRLAALLPLGRRLFGGAN